MAKRNMLTCVYTDDDGINYLKRMDARYQALNDGADPPQVLLGANPATPEQRRTLPIAPRNLKPRRVIAQTADGAFLARLPVFSLARYVGLANGTVIDFWDGQGVQHAGFVVGHEGEQKLHDTDVA